MQNKYGLTREIPAAVKRAVRQRDGFGCVVCGCALIEYEHFEPEFAEARAHQVGGIILLCAGCHAKKTRGHLSRDTIAMAKANPATKKLGFSFEAFDVGGNYPEIALGKMVGRETPSLIRILDEDVLQVLPPEQGGGPFRLSACFRDSNENVVLCIDENEWRSPTTNWDVEVVGRRIAVRQAQGSIAVVLRTDLPNRLTVERLDLAHRGFRIECREGHLTSVRTPSGVEVQIDGGTFVRAKGMIVLDGKGVGIGFL
ncbi:MAG: HNH endonuclease [Hyphomonadaceae bacterium]